MKSLIALILLSLLISCGKKEESTPTQNIQSEIINALNHDDYKRALTLIERAAIDLPNDPQLEYYKAQAYSIKAGIDIYSLFPLMKMKLFSVAITEWDNVNKYSERNNQSVNSTISGTRELSSKDDLNKRKEEILKIPLDKVTFEVTMEHKGLYYNYMYDNDGNQTDVVSSSCYGSLKITSDLFPKKKSITQHIYFEIQADEKCDDFYPKEIEARERNAHRIVRAEAARFIDSRIKNIKDQQAAQKYIKAGFALFESVPILRKLPTLVSSNADIVHTALKILDKTSSSNKIDDRLQKNVGQQMGILSSFLIIGSLKNAIDFDKVQEPHDIVCELRPEILLDYYPHVRVGMKYLIKSAEDSKFTEKNKENIKKIQSILDSAPNELSDKQKARIIDEITEYTGDNC